MSPSRTLARNGLLGDWSWLSPGHLFWTRENSRARRYTRRAPREPTAPQRAASAPATGRALPNSMERRVTRGIPRYRGCGCDADFPFLIPQRGANRPSFRVVTARPEGHSRVPLRL